MLKIRAKAWEMVYVPFDYVDCYVHRGFDWLSENTFNVASLWLWEKWDEALKEANKEEFDESQKT